ncbi:MAG TPA: UbiD family decarboxylase [Candidatus Eisenbacteria bacterium]|nr:UbiD family decarboxylase [Candidatus Eisenbacteria bacterium]
MPFSDLRSFLTHLERQGDLHRVRVEVDPEYEIAEIAQRAIREDKPALLFERVHGSRYPVAINVLGTRRRVEAALGRAPEAVGAELIAVFERLRRPSPRTILSGLPLGRLWNARVEKRATGPARAVVEDPDLDSLPILRCWPEDGGRFVTFGLVLTADPRSGERNLGLYRMHVFGPRETGMHWQIQKGGGFHYHVAEKQGEALPVTVTIGADPCLLLSAVAPLPEGVDELLFAAWLRGGPTRLAHAARVDAWAPESAEFVLEGLVAPGERRLEGPFGDHFGHYSHAAPFPVFHLEAVTHRRDPVYLASVVGKPPQEDRALGEAVGAMMGPLVRLVHREITDLAAWYEAGFHNLLVVAVEERYAKEGLRAALGLLGTGQLSLTKCLLLVDQGTDLRDWRQILAAIRDHFEPSEDFLLLPGVPLDTLDFTSGRMNLGSKMILDATGKRAVGPGNRPDEVAPRTGAAAVDGAMRERWSRFLEAWRREPGARQARIDGDCWLTVQVEGPGRALVERLVAEPALAGLKVVVAVSPDVPLDDETLHLWGMFTRFDAAKDVVFTESRLVGAWPGYQGRMGIDATFKEGYPRPVVMDPETVRKVDRRWNEYWS